MKVVSSDTTDSTRWSTLAKKNFKLLEQLYNRLYKKMLAIEKLEKAANGDTESIPRSLRVNFKLNLGSLEAKDDLQNQAVELTKNFQQEQTKLQVATILTGIEATAHGASAIQTWRSRAKGTRTRRHCPHEQSS